jgi:23S rRNA pseudouridine2605 synthase
MKMDARVGLARAISKIGYCSRSRAFEAIRAGRVKLNGRVLRDGETPVHLGKDQIEVDGRELIAQARVYLALNKPRGVITTASDEKGRETVYSLLPAGLTWVAPVGRLDKASEGLLLLTNDSEWASRITDPDTHLEKTYHVQVGSLVDSSLLQQLRRGVRAADGETLRVKSAALLRSGEKNSWVELILEEGKNRQIRRIFEAMKMQVLRLLRVAIGPMVLGDLAKGSWRKLTAQEKRALDLFVDRHKGS